MYSSLLSFGDLIPLNLKCNVQKLMLQIKGFEYKKYNSLFSKQNRKTSTSHDCPGLGGPGVLKPDPAYIFHRD